MRPTIIGITGLAGSGKSTAAEFICDSGEYTRVSFATPLKDMLRKLGIDCADKEATPDILCGKTVRYALQTLGTEWGRQLIGQDIWARSAMEYAQHRLPVVFDDVRFENEAQAIIDAGGEIWQIVRPGLEAMDHASEAGIPSSLVSRILYNDRTAEELIQLVRSIVDPRYND